MSNIMYTSSVPELSGPSASGPCVQDNQKKGQRHDQTHLHLLASRYQYSPENNSNTWQKMMSGTPKDVSSLALAQAQLQESATYQQQQSAILPPNHAESEATLADDDLLPPLSEPINPQAPQQQQQQQQQNFQQNNQLFGYPEAQSQQYAIAPSCEPRVGDFILTETIGEGTFGKVKLGVHYQNGEKCAVKAIQKSKIKTVKQMNSVQREVRLMKLLKHPHIVDVKETLEDGDQIFLVMEYASGGELFDYIAQQCQQDENMARLYFRQVVSAINYCHHNSIIHRDLKPENLLLDKNGNIKIIDFGFGNTFHRDRTLDTYCGSPYYAAPEMVKGIPYTGPEVDIWSLGVILYALITGNLPFDSRDMSVLYALIAKGEYEPIKTSDTANHLVSTMLMVNPLKRAKMNDVIDHPWCNYGYTEKIQSHIVQRPTIVENPSSPAIAELVSYGISEREIRRLLNLDCGLHPIKSLYFLVADYLNRSKTQKSRPGQSFTALQPIHRGSQQPQQTPFRPTSAPIPTTQQQLQSAFLMSAPSFQPQHVIHNSTQYHNIQTPHRASSLSQSHFHHPMYNFVHMTPPSGSPLNTRFDAMLSSSPPNNPFLHHPLPQYQAAPAISFNLQQHQNHYQPQLQHQPPPHHHHQQPYPGYQTQCLINPSPTFQAQQPQFQYQRSSNIPLAQSQSTTGTTSGYPFDRSATPVKRKEEEFACNNGSSSSSSTPSQVATPKQTPTQDCSFLATTTASKSSPGSRLFKALATGLRPKSKKKSRVKEEDGNNESDVDLQATTGGRTSVSIRPQPASAAGDSPASFGRKSVFSPPNLVSNGRRLGNGNNSGSCDEVLDRSRRDARCGRGAHTRESEEGSEVVWGMKWTAAHKEPEECDEELYEDDDDVDGESVKVVYDDDGKVQVDQSASPIAKAGTTSLVHRLFGKKS